MATSSLTLRSFQVECLCASRRSGKPRCATFFEPSGAGLGAALDLLVRKATAQSDIVRWRTDGNARCV